MKKSKLKESDFLLALSTGASLHDDITKYFWFHHTHGDTMTVQKPSEMNHCAALWTVVSYVIADMEEKLPV